MLGKIQATAGSNDEHSSSIGRDDGSAAASSVEQISDPIVEASFEARSQASALSRLSDQALDESSVRAAANERKSIHTVLLHLREVDRRRLYAKLGYGSLFEYTVKHLKYSEGSASRRIAAARLLRNMPEIAESVESGALNLTNILALQTTIRAEEKRSGAKFDVKKKRELLSMIENKPQAEVVRELVELFPQVAQFNERERALSGNKTQITMTLESEHSQRAERIRELASHISDNFSWLELFDFLMKYYLKHEDPIQKPLKDSGDRKHSEAHSSTQRFAGLLFMTGAVERLESNPENVASIAEPASMEDLSRQDAMATRPAQSAGKSRRQSRYVSVFDERQLHRRSGSQCEWVDSKTGVRCTRRYHLQPDHVVPVSKGGNSDIENLQLLCRAHNLWKGSRLLRSYVGCGTR